MGDAIKIAVKTALVVGITAGILALFVNIKIPAFDFSVISQPFSVALAVATNWVPAFSILWPLALASLGLKLAILVFDVGSIAVRWIMKVNE